VTELVCRLEDGKAGPVPKPKAFIQWVGEHAAVGSPVLVDEVRIFHPLFKSDNPAAQDDYLADINPNSLEIIKGAMVEVGFWGLAKSTLLAARKEAERRTAAAPPAVTTEGEEKGHPHDTPTATVEQLIGNEAVRFQGLRVAYFALDKDAKLASTKEDEATSPARRPGDVIILNRIVSLKEDSGKSA